jgi:putative transposase
MSAAARSRTKKVQGPKATPKARRGRPSRDPAAPPEVLRVDLLEHAMNAGKEAMVRALLAVWRVCAVAIAREQWALFEQVGTFDRYHTSPVESYLARLVGSARRVQMVRSQVVGVLKSFLSNRSNDFRREVGRGGFDARTKHELNTLNVAEAIFSPRAVKMKDGRTISPEVRALAREIMRRVLARHRRPDLSRINMVLDQRVVRVSEADNRAEGFSVWVTLKVLDGSEIAIPLVSHAYFQDRKGLRKRSIQINEREDGTLVFGLITDIAATAQSEKARYARERAERAEQGQAVCVDLCLDWGLRTLFASSEGDLFGRGFLSKLKEYDARISRLASYRQKHEGKTRSPRYDREVRSLRGFLETEIRRVLNRAVEVHRPVRIVVEQLDFRNPALSRRMNRLLSLSGRAVVKEKLADLEERFGIEVVVVNPAYSSQSCRVCGYVDVRNRKGEHFECLWCGLQEHADVHGARGLGARCSRPELSHVSLPKEWVLRALVRQHTERWGRPRGEARDPRLSNPYFKEWKAEVISSGLLQDATAQPCAAGT